MFPEKWHRPVLSINSSAKLLKLKARLCKQLALLTWASSLFLHLNSHQYEGTRIEWGGELGKLNSLTFYEGLKTLPAI